MCNEGIGWVVMRFSDYICLICALLILGICIYDILKHRDKEVIKGIIIEINKGKGISIGIALFILFACGVIIFELLFMTEKDKINGLLLLVLTLNAIYNITMNRFISAKGIGMVNKFFGSYRDFIQWSEMKEWKWNKYDNNSLTIKYERKSKKQELEWKIPLDQKEEIEKVFNQFFKNHSLS